MVAISFTTAMPRISGRRDTSSTSGRSFGSSGGARRRSTIQSVPPARSTVLSLRPARAERVRHSSASVPGRSNGQSAISAGFTRGLLFRGVPDRLDDALVARAAADVARDALANLALARLRVRREEGVRGHEDAGRADAALRAALLHESLLQVGKRVPRGEPLDGEDRSPVALARHDKARVHGDAVQEHGARAALALAAALFRAGEPERPSEDVEEAREGRRIERTGTPVHDEGHSHVPALRASKRSSGRSGRSSRTIPVACSIAAAIAGAPPSIGSSPMPFAPPPGPFEYGSSTRIVVKRGASRLVGTSEFVMRALRIFPSLKTTFSFSAQLIACNVPPAICPLHMTGWMALPTSCAAQKQRTLVSNVSRSTLTSAMSQPQPKTG